MIRELIILVYIVLSKFFSFLLQKKVKNECILHGVIESKGFSRGIDGKSEVVRMFLSVGGKDAEIVVSNTIVTKPPFFSDIVLFFGQDLFLNPVIKGTAVQVRAKVQWKVYRWFVSWFVSENDKSELREFTEKAILTANNISQEGGLQRHFFLEPTV